PASSTPPLLEGFAASERARLVLEHVQVVVQVEDLLMPLVRARVARNAASLVPDLDRGWRQLDLDRGTRCHWRGVRVGPGFDAAQPVDLAKAHLDQIEALAGQWQQVLAFDGQR